MKKENFVTYILTGLIAVLCAVLIFLIPVLINTINAAKEPNEYIEATVTATDLISTPTITSTPLPTPEPTPFSSEATICAMGDLLMHEPIIKGYKTADGYDFNEMFKHISPYISSADYAVANLETTLRGLNDGYSYSGYPCFNCPDEIIDGAKSAGFDMLLTANNHSYDTRYKGMTRTLEVIDEKNLDRLGIVKNEEEKNYIVKDINGINVGMICYTYETDNSNKVALNGIPLSDDASKLVNTFSYGELSDFYEKLNNELTQMKKDGAEAFVLFIHWGEEYQTKQNKNQEKIAQKVCDLGFDVIVGGHPHVVQPVDLLTSSTDENHKTVCLYSMGNAVSNQRRTNMNLTTGHTEDGVIFFFTFAKKGDNVSVSNVKIIPTWVNKQTSKVKSSYEIYPIESETVSSDFSSNLKNKLSESFKRTDKIVGDGLDKIEEALKKAS